MTPAEHADQLEGERARRVPEYAPSVGERQAQRRRMLLLQEAEQHSRQLRVVREGAA